MHGKRKEHHSNIQGQESTKSRKTWSQAVVGRGARIHRHQMSKKANCTQAMHKFGQVLPTGNGECMNNSSQVAPQSGDSRSHPQWDQGTLSIQAPSGHRRSSQRSERTWVGLSVSVHSRVGVKKMERNMNLLGLSLGVGLQWLHYPSMTTYPLLYQSTICRKVLIHYFFRSVTLGSTPTKHPVWEYIYQTTFSNLYKKSSYTSYWW